MEGNRVKVQGQGQRIERMNHAVMFWKEYLCKDTIWSEASCRQVYDEIIGTCIHDIEQLDLNYKINRIANVQSGD